MRVSRATLIRLAVLMTSLYFWVAVVLYTDLQWREKVKQQIRKFHQSPTCYDGPLPDFLSSTNTTRSSIIKARSRLLPWCFLNETPADIQIEQEWDSIDVFYPKYVLSVSGWIEMVTVSSWQPKPLKVIIVPHSHQDPGWLFTFEEYYRMSARKVLPLLIDHLTSHPSWTFIWSEVCYLSRWWKTANQTQRVKFKRLLDRGQLEIVSGGWVMPDEAVTHYGAMLDQLTEGNLWLKENLGITPNVSWSIDPFGHSPTMAYLMKRNNAVAMVTQRVHYAVKRHLAKKKSLEFYWRQAWGSGYSTDILCHTMPFLNYDITHSCGPDQHVCCKYDFSRKKCFHGSSNIQAEMATDENIEKLSWLLWEQLQKKAELYTSGVLLVPFGDDFRYETGREWSKLLGNMEKIIKFINNEGKMNMKVRFGTLSDYFTEVKRAIPRMPNLLPTLSGDFFPYTDRSDQYWTGFYTSRPHLKAMSRRVQSLLRSTEILFSLSLARKSTRKVLNDLVEELLNETGTLISARQELALFQHHDAITGTSKFKVMVDYGMRLFRAYTGLQQLYSRLIQTVMISSTVNRTQSTESQDLLIYPMSKWPRSEKLIEKVMINISKARTILLHNSVAHDRQDVVHLLVNRSRVKVVDKVTRKVIQHQISPVLEGSTFRKGVFELSFEVTLPTLSIRAFMILTAEKFQCDSMSKVKVVKASHQPDVEDFIMSKYTQPTFSIRNSQFIATYFSCNGRLQYLTKIRHGKTSKFEVKVMTYGTGSWSNLYKDLSGAYTFMPNGDANVLDETVSDLYVIEGPIYSRVITVQPAITHTVTLYKADGPLGAALVMENIVDIRHHNNTELVLRLESEVKDKQSTMCTDLNGFQMHRRQWKEKLKIQGNFYPMTTMSVIEDETDRLTVLTASSCGVASLCPGCIEMVLDRKLNQHDWRGLNEGVTDNVPTYSQFMVLLERRELRDDKGSELLCHPSEMANILYNQIEQPLTVSVVKESHDSAVDSKTRFLTGSLPCNIRLVNLRYMETTDTGQIKVLLTLHRQHTDCSYTSNVTCSVQPMTSIASMFTGVHVESVFIMSITGNHVDKEMDPLEELHIQPMEIMSYMVIFK